MTRRITLLVLSQLCILPLAATAAEEPVPSPAAAASPALAGPAAQTPDLGWLQRLDANASLIPQTEDGPLGATFRDTCLQQCLQSGEDLICCRYLCNPIGMNPC